MRYQNLSQHFRGDVANFLESRERQLAGRPTVESQGVAHDPIERASHQTFGMDTFAEFEAQPGLQRVGGDRDRVVDFEPAARTLFEFVRLLRASASAAPSGQLCGSSPRTRHDRSSRAQRL